MNKEERSTCTLYIFVMQSAFQLLQFCYCQHILHDKGLRAHNQATVGMSKQYFHCGVGFVPFVAAVDCSPFFQANISSHKWIALTELHRHTAVCWLVSRLCPGPGPCHVSDTVCNLQFICCIWTLDILICKFSDNTAPSSVSTDQPMVTTCSSVLTHTSTLPLVTTPPVCSIQLDNKLSPSSPSTFSILERIKIFDLESNCYKCMYQINSHYTNYQ